MNKRQQLKEAIKDFLKVEEPEDDLYDAVMKYRQDHPAPPVEVSREEGVTWKIVYDNDDNGGWNEWWTVENEDKRYTCETEEDALWLSSQPQ